MRNILIFSHEFPPMIGGEGTYSFNLAKGFAQNNYNVTVLSGENFNNHDKFSDFDKNLKKELGIEIFRYPWIKKDRLWFITWVNRFNKIINKYKFDHIFFSNFSSLIIGHKIKYVNCEYTITLHGDDVDYFFNPLRKPKSLFLINFFKRDYFFKNAKNIICVSDYLKQKLFKYKKFKNVRVIHHGIEPLLDSAPKKKFLESQNLSFLYNKKIISYVSRLEKDKGHDVLFDYIIKNKEKLNDYIFLIIGDGSLANEYNRFIIKNNLKNIILVGKKTRSEIFNFLKISYAKMFFSYHKNETFGLVIIEALSQETPVFVLDNGAVKEIIDHEKSGIIISDKSSIDMINDYLFNNNKLNKISKEGLILFNEKFNLKSMMKKVIPLI